MFKLTKFGEFKDNIRIVSGKEIDIDNSTVVSDFFAYKNIKNNFSDNDYDILGMLPGTFYHLNEEILPFKSLNYKIKTKNDYFNFNFNNNFVLINGREGDKIIYLTPCFLFYFRDNDKIRYNFIIDDEIHISVPLFEIESSDMVFSGVKNINTNKAGGIFKSFSHKLNRIKGDVEYECVRRNYYYVC